MDSIGSMVTLIFTIAFAVTVAFGAVVGLVRGMSKSVIRLVVLALAAILTFVIAGPVTTLVAQNIQIEGATLGQLVLNEIRSEATVAAILDAAPLLQQAILVAPAFILSLVMFPLVFCVLSFISWIVFLFVQKPLRKLIFKDSCNKEEAAAKPMGLRVGLRFAGLGIGIVTGALIFGMTITPLLGLFTVLPEKSVMDASLNTLAQQNILSDKDTANIQQSYGVTDCFVVKLYRGVGLSAAGRNYISAVSRIEADGQITSLPDEFGSLFATIQTATEGGLVNALLSPEDPNALYAVLGDKVFMDALMQDMFQSKLLRSAVPEVMAIAMKTMATSMKVPENKTAVYNNMMDSIALAVKDADIDYAAIQAYEAAYGSAAALSRSGSDSGLMTQEEYEAEIEKLAELVETISSILNKSISGDNKAFTDSIANHIVSEVKTQAAENGESALENFDATSVQNTIATIDAASIDAGESDAGVLLEQLTDQEKFETDIATVETITEAIRESVKNAVADDSQAAETASTLASVVSDFAGAVSSATDENGDLDITQLDFEKIASAVTTLQNSTLKSVGSSVLDIVASGDLGDNGIVSNAMGALKEGYENGEDIGGTINSAGALINLGAAMGGKGGADQDAMVDSLTSLINNLNEFTIDLLPSILPTDSITSMGVPTKYADSTYDVIETLLTELMELKGAADYDAEVNSILSLYDLVTSGVENFGADDIDELASYAIQSDAIFNTLKSVSTSNPFGIEITSEATRLELTTAIEDGYAKSGKTQRDLDVYNAIATLLGLDENVNLG